MDKALWIADGAQVPVMSDEAEVLVVSVSRVAKVEAGMTLKFGPDDKCPWQKEKFSAVLRTMDGCVERSIKMTLPISRKMMLACDKESAKKLLCEAVDMAYAHPTMDRMMPKG